MTVCNISRNDAARRVAAVLEGKPDPGQSVPTKAPVPTEIDTPEAPDLTLLAHDQIVKRIQSRFTGHALARLVDAVLQADGWETKISPPGADGGVDILAGRGSLGLDAPRLCVQVKSQNSPADVTVYRTLQGTMQTFKAEQGLLVCWGGVNKVVLAESRQGHFMVRLWDSRDLVRAIYRTYERLPGGDPGGITTKASVDACRRGACGMSVDLPPLSRHQGLRGGLARRGAGPLDNRATQVVDAQHRGANHRTARRRSLRRFRARRELDWSPQTCWSRCLIR